MLFIDRFSGLFWKEMNQNQWMEIFGWKMEVDEDLMFIRIIWDVYGILEPMPCSMDNWGEGVVPACREEQPKMFGFF